MTSSNLRDVGQFQARYVVTVRCNLYCFITISVQCVLLVAGRRIAALDAIHCWRSQWSKLWEFVSLSDDHMLELLDWSKSSPAVHSVYWSAPQTALFTDVISKLFKATCSEAEWMWRIHVAGTQAGCSWQCVMARRPATDPTCSAGIL